ncbi:polysaccharide biosynthesis tyrosine autokinase [Plantactinospora siamensis]|uniref:Polysaccharide biosynthesis tyrosine autokinase n=1 Tax=Plantactinospora siamensis TaxID=555372 RepID=A0ABV6P444_9ACTN
MAGWRTMRAVRRSWWLVLVALVVGSGVAWGVTAAVPPRYEADTVFLLSSTGTGPSDVFQGGAYARDRADLYADLAHGERLAAMVAARDGIGLTGPQVQGRLSAQRTEDTALIRVAVTDTDRGRTERLAEAVSEEFGKLVAKLETPAGHKSALLRAEPVAGPTLNPNPVFPRPLRNLGIGLLLGLVVGVLAAAARETFDRTVRGPDQLVEAAMAPVVAVVPHRGWPSRRPVVVDAGYQPAAEPFRQLRTRLSHRDGSIPHQVVVITSPVPRDGRSSTAANLALAFAATGKRVLLVEADWRTPRVGRYLGLEPGAGLSDVLDGRLDSAGAVRRLGNSTLWVLAAGTSPNNPSELLDSPAMAELLRRERNGYDVILIDTPPVLPVADATVLAGHADGVVLVTRAGRVTDEQVRAAAEMLRDVGARVLGCVLNDVRRWDVAAGRHAGYRSGPPAAAVVPLQLSAATVPQAGPVARNGTAPAETATARSASPDPTPDAGRGRGPAR